MVRSNAIEIVCGDLYSAKVNFAGDRPYSDPYISFKVTLDGSKIERIDNNNDGVYIEFNSGDDITLYGAKSFPQYYEYGMPNPEMIFNIPIVDGVLEIPDLLTDIILPVRTDYDIFVSVPTVDDNTGHYTPVYRNVIEFLPRTNKIL